MHRIIDLHCDTIMYIIDGKKDLATLDTTHSRHISDLVGFEALAMGSDYDGIDSTLEWNDYCGNITLMERISESFGEKNAERIAWKNAYRTLKECIG